MAMRVERWWYAARVKARRVLRRQAVDQELDDELRSHVAHEVATLRAAGVSRREARRQALARLGGIEPTKESVRAIRPGVSGTGHLEGRLWHGSSPCPGHTPGGRRSPGLLDRPDAG